MLKLKILTIGKTKETWLEEALEEYLKRLSPVMSVEFALFKDDPSLVRAAEKEPYLLCLDPEGKLMTSEEFAHFIDTSFQKGGSRLALVIGGAEGLPSELKKGYPLLSLSPLTLTHQLTRLVLIEQIYRAYEILKGSKYHK